MAALRERDAVEAASPEDAPRLIDVAVVLLILLMVTVPRMDRRVPALDGTPDATPALRDATPPAAAGGQGRDGEPGSSPRRSHSKGLQRAVGIIRTSA